MIDKSELKLIDESIEDDIKPDLRHLYCMTYNTIMDLCSI